MGKDTSIGWTDSTFNFAMGCKMVSPGCANCYMFRYLKTIGKDPSVVNLTKQGQAKDLLGRLDALGEKIFVNSMTDTFHDSIDDGMIYQWFQVFEHLPNHQFQILTKRAERMRNWCRHYCITHGRIPDNIWMGVSVENQDYLGRIDALRDFACKIRFVSFEPLLGPIDKPDLHRISWIVIGGESGDNPRPMKIEWAQDLIDYTRKYYPECAIFFKQVGGRGRDGAGGCIINGREIKEFPKYN